MVTVLREAGLRFSIYSADHDPPHVHVRGDGSMKIGLFGAAGEPEVIWAKGMQRNDISRAWRIACERRDYLLEEWKKIHARPD